MTKPKLDDTDLPQKDKTPMNKQPEEIWDLYNIKGEPLNRTMVRGRPLKAGEYHLVAHIWIKNSNGEYLIQKRAEGKKTRPGMWAITAGSVLAGETAQSGAIRELHEEIGVVALPHELRVITQVIRRYSIATLWLLERDVKDEEITLQEEEVSAVMWANEAAIRRMIAEGTFYDYGAEYLEAVFR